MESTAVRDRSRCPDCGGLNPPGAQWCSVCLRRFAPPAPPSTAMSAAPRAMSAPGAGAPGYAAPAPATHSVTSSPQPGPQQAGFTVTEHGITWTCRVCDSANMLAATMCSVCGAAIAETLREPEPEGPPRDPGTAALLSLILPGVGHGYLNMWPEAIARGIISVWVVSVTLFAALSGRGGMMTFVAVLFGATAFGLWGAAAHDAYRIAGKEADLVILRGRFFLYLVLGLLFLLFVCLSVSAMSLRSA